MLIFFIWYGVKIKKNTRATPLQPVTEVEFCRYNKRIARDEKMPMLSIFKILDQLSTSKVRSTTSSAHIISYGKLLSEERWHIDSNATVFLSSRLIETLFADPEASRSEYDLRSHEFKVKWGLSRVKMHINLGVLATWRQWDHLHCFNSFFFCKKHWARKRSRLHSI